MRLAPAFSPAANAADVWHDLVYNATWHNQWEPYYGKCQYTKSLTGEVLIRGVVSSFGGNGIIGYLPEGYRPSRQERFPVFSDAGTWTLVIFPETGAIDTFSSLACNNMMLNHLRFDPR